MGEREGREGVEIRRRVGKEARCDKEKELREARAKQQVREQESE
jgi:hypothetical protein